MEPLLLSFAPLAAFAPLAVLGEYSPVLEDLDAVVLEVSQELLQGGFHGAAVVGILEMVFGAELELRWLVANLLVASFLVASSLHMFRFELTPGNGSAAEMAPTSGNFLELGIARVVRVARLVAARVTRVVAVRVARVVAARVARVASTLAVARVAASTLVGARVAASTLVGARVAPTPVVPFVLGHSLPGTRSHVVFLLVMALLALEDGAVAGLRWHFH